MSSIDSSKPPLFPQKPAAQIFDDIQRIKHPLIGVLDHGFVRLVNSMGSDLDIVRSARVSYNADWRGPETSEELDSLTSKDEKLIAYLLRNHHTSPFESVVFTFEIKCPIFVARQWHRHRTWAYNEVSARYTELPEEYYLPELKQITSQSKDNKQMRTEEIHFDCGYIQDELHQAHKNSFKIYKMLLELECPRELARSVLPVSTYTRFFGTVNLHNLFHFLRLRAHPHAQYEIRVYAMAIIDIIQQIVPVATKYFLPDVSEHWVPL
ncbi:MAG TPA: FAD-dependent thymidylate synthase [Patescibacteria group bacterium]